MPDAFRKASADEDDGEDDRGGEVEAATEVGPTPLLEGPPQVSGLTMPAKISSTSSKLHPGYYDCTR